MWNRNCFRCLVPMSLFDTKRLWTEFQTVDLQMVIPGSGAVQVAKNIPVDPGPSHVINDTVLCVLYTPGFLVKTTVRRDLCNLILKKWVRCREVFPEK